MIDNIKLYEKAVQSFLRYGTILPEIQSELCQFLFQHKICPNHDKPLYENTYGKWINE